MKLTFFFLFYNVLSKLTLKTNEGVDNMKIFSFFFTFLANGDADKTAAHNMTESFTGNGTYWNPTLKAK
jgi:hypothetical protein